MYNLEWKMINISYLIPLLRLKLGDIDSTAYRYLDEWLLIALVASVGVLQRYWRFKYIITDLGDVTRNSGFIYFDRPEEEGVIQDSDEYIIVLMAAITVIKGDLEKSAWNLASWKDYEISYNPNEGGRIRSDILKSMQDELDDLLLPPTKRLARPKKGSLPGYKDNDFERNTRL